MVYEQIYEILNNKDDITWQTLLIELVKSEQMDLWDIDVSMLSKKYIEVIKHLKELDFNISGKMVLAAAILLRIKSKRLLENDIEHFDQMMSGEDEDSLYDEQGIGPEGKQFQRVKGIRLIPKTPQPRRRKVSIYELMEALQKALETNRRRLNRIIHLPEMHIPEKKVDISQLIRDTYDKLTFLFAEKDEPKITFSHLAPPGSSKRDKIYTLIPLLHLSNLRKIDLEQEVCFGEINILLNTNKEISKELDDELAELEEKELKEKESETD